MRRLLLILGLALLTACTPPEQGFRKGDAAMQSVVGFDPARFSGAWHEVAAIGRAPGARWRVAVHGPEALTITTTRDGSGSARLIGPGRMRATNFSAPLWVLWADGDMRTIVLGTTDGRFAMVLDRARSIAPDRLRAAREILAWNGYDLGALR